LEDKGNTFDIFKKFALGPKMSLGHPWWRLEVTMDRNSTTQEWKSIVMVKASSMNSLQPIHHNKMVW
jgi:hypothetical protein